MSSHGVAAPGPVPGFNNTSYTEANLPTAAAAALALPIGYRVMCTDSGVERVLLTAGGIPYWLPVGSGGGSGIVVDTVLYADSVNGSDVTGTGTAARPFATFARAYALIPPNPTGKARIMLLGAGPYTLPASLKGTYPAGASGQPLVVCGDAPTVLAAGAVTAVSNPTVTTNVPTAQDQYRGCYYVGLTGTSAGRVYCIATNDAAGGLTSIGFTFGASIGDTFQIVQPSTVVQAPAGGLNVVAGDVAFWRCKLAMPNGASIVVNDGAQMWLDACEVSIPNARLVSSYRGRVMMWPFLFSNLTLPITDVGTQAGVGGCYVHGSTLGNTIRANEEGAFYGYLVTDAPTLLAADGGLMVWLGIDVLNAGTGVVAVSIVQGGRAIISGAWQRIAFTGNAGNVGLSVTNGGFATVNNTLFQQCTAQALIVASGGEIDAQNCTGSTGNGAGASVQTGGILWTLGGNTVTGAGGDVVIDGRAAITWAQAVSQPGLIASGAGQPGAMLPFALLHAGGAGAVTTFAGAGGLPVAANSSATALRYPVTPGRLAKNLRATVLANASAAAVALTVMKAPVATGVPAATALTVTVGSNATGSFADTTHSAQYNDGDQIDVQASSTAGGAGNNFTATASVQLSA